MRRLVARIGDNSYLLAGFASWSAVFTDRFELAWAAGFFDGEGWANAAADNSRGKHYPQARVNQADSSGVPSVLLRFQRALGGLGRIHGPDVYEGRKDLYRWEVSSRGDVELLHHFLLPWLGEVKLMAFARALDRAAARSRAASPSGDWRAWAAGLFDGEGSTYLLRHRSHEGYKIGEIALTQGGLGMAPEVLRRLLSALQLGHINGPYAQEDANLDVYRWKVTKQDDLAAAIGAIWPWLDRVKREQARLVLDTLSTQPALPRGRPEWGNRKSHCIRGHEYATNRVKPYRARAGGTEPRDSEQCLKCAREQARVRRAQKKSAANDDRRSMSESGATYLLK